MSTERTDPPQHAGAPDDRWRITLRLPSFRPAPEAPGATADRRAPILEVAGFLLILAIAVSVRVTKLGTIPRLVTADEADNLRAKREPNVTGTLGWGTGPRLFDWITPEAHELAREALREAALTAEPLGRTRGEHGDLEPILSCARIIRQWEQMSTRAGLPIQSPFLDDRVIEACLSVRPEERVTPWRYKPVLTEAMRGIVPDECLARTTKAQASLEASAGLRRHRGDLVERARSGRAVEGHDVTR